MNALGAAVTGANLAHLYAWTGMCHHSDAEPPIPTNDLYSRLKDFGFDRAFVDAHLLPDWWEEKLFSVPANRAIAEGYISRMLGVPITQLADPAAPLSAALSAVKFKHKKGTQPVEMSPAVLLAQQCAASFLRASALPAHIGPRTADEVRSMVLAEFATVNMASLLAIAQRCGVLVFHLAQVPKKSKRFTGLAMVMGQSPVVVLGFKTDSAPWLTWTLAHELGHIFLGHVKPGEVMTDDLSEVDDAEQEHAANRFACQVLTGVPAISASVIYGMTAINLAATAQSWASKFRTDPGVMALIYGREAGRLAVANGALKILGLTNGARATILAALLAVIREPDDEIVQQCLALATA